METESEIWKSLVLPARVAIGRLFTLGSFGKITEVAYIIVLL
jgi:hypothetical protein